MGGKLKRFEERGITSFDINVGIAYVKCSFSITLSLLVEFDPTIWPRDSHIITYVMLHVPLAIHKFRLFDVFNSLSSMPCYTLDSSS